ncbi:hypothetical protein L9Z73_03445 [Pseudomonas sp. TNT11]|uniref:Phage tail protein n=1 Tax=Pseudomonas emilianonis TaxID=2915812 RepID=A0ABT0ECL2_9PSED|nr:hypothetical protein [Pseudomonas emilianonis]MCK1783448.1 hypothetical protein [Pseudomonas emilianonis]
MKFLNVLKSFKLNLAEGVILDFEAGLHEVEDEVAAHWYVVANSEPLTTKQANALQGDTSGDDQADADAKAKADADAKAEADAKAKADADAKAKA